ncbi:MAG TPA: iron-containing alcohol dehydrogenase, partial [Streptosporangiaceae bacterium]|nr:iron-containing alcohol dehydrogenase [Streptosporangiaceae bacterium]
MRFVHQTLPQRVVFAAGDSPAAVASEIEALGRSKVLLIASGREEAQAAPIMAKIPVVLRHDEVVMHVPVAVAARAREAAACGADIVVTVGGGSATGRVLAQEGIAGLAAGLPLVKAAPSSLEGIEQTLYGAYLAAVSFAGAGSGMHHKICHVLGGMFNLPHAETHAVVLPHVLAYNAPSAPEAERRIAQGFGSATAREGLR